MTKPPNTPPTDSERPPGLPPLDQLDPKNPATPIVTLYYLYSDFADATDAERESSAKVFEALEQRGEANQELDQWFNAFESMMNQYWQLLETRERLDASLPRLWPWAALSEQLDEIDTGLAHWVAMRWRTSGLVLYWAMAMPFADPQFRKGDALLRETLGIPVSSKDSGEQLQNLRIALHNVLQLVKEGDWNRLRGKTRKELRRSLHWKRRDLSREERLKNTDRLEVSPKGKRRLTRLKPPPTIATG
jgi:hypothetical protein